ncbi:hypothetical protein CPT_Phriendly_055 [Vibrio phage Phriendly]|nr:hypothetical protein CPT_Phriendly_055 [Vibrio phage Phriendly]
MKQDYKTVYKEQADGSLELKHTQKVDHIIDTNKELAKESQDGKDMKLAARIPMNVIFAWQQEGIDMSLVGVDPEMTAKFWKKLQDPEWANLRVWNGRVV